jgi:hypothetical protein
MRFLSRFFDSNDRELSKIQPLIDRTNDLEPEYEALSDEEIRERIDLIRADVSWRPPSPRSSPRTSGSTRTSSGAGTFARPAAGARTSASARPSTTSSRRSSPPAARP